MNVNGNEESLMRSLFVACDLQRVVSKLHSIIYSHGLAIRPSDNFQEWLIEAFSLWDDAKQWG